LLADACNTIFRMYCCTFLAMLSIFITLFAVTFVSTTHKEHIFVFPWQQWLFECTTMLHHIPTFVNLQIGEVSHYLCMCKYIHVELSSFWKNVCWYCKNITSKLKHTVFWHMSTCHFWRMCWCVCLCVKSSLYM